jgi:tRNA A37 threonylcarbamoyladenosine modification protein TsaB
MSVAKGICYALDIPLYLHNRLTLLAYHIYSKSKNDFSRFISIIIAREKEYFIAVYDNQFNCTLEPIHVNEEQMVNLITSEENKAIITDTNLELINSLNINKKFIEKDTTINLFLWAKFACEQYECNKNVKLSIAEPFYLKSVYTHN